MWRITAFVITLIGSQAMMMAQLPSANAQNCTSQFEFSGRFCVRGNCSVLRQKVRFLGQKVLLYPDPSKDEGTIFQLGQSLDMRDADISWRGSGPPGSTQSATASAEQRGNDYFLTIHQRWSLAGRVIGEHWQKLTIQVLDCESCAMLDYQISFTGSKGGLVSSFDRYYCRRIE
jgi:hypothetical protein